MSRGGQGALLQRPAGYIMAGGASSRFGVDKALVKFGGRRMLEHMLDLMRAVTPNVKIVAAGKKYSEIGIETVADRWPGEGALGGIITALLDARADSSASAPNHPSRVVSQLTPSWCLIVSCDIPFLTKDWLKYLVQRAESSAADVVLPVSEGGPEPLCACWRTQAADLLRSVFERGVRKVMEGVSHGRAELLDEKDWKRFDSSGRLFWNMNTQADYKEALRILEAGRR